VAGPQTPGGPGLKHQIISRPVALPIEWAFISIPCFGDAHCERKASDKLPAMHKLLDSFWRAALYCVHPRVMALSLLPLAVMTVLALGLGYLFWADALAALRGAMESFSWIARLTGWLEGIGLTGVNAVLAPVLLLTFSVPLIVIASLLFVSILMTPAMVTLVADRRFPTLEKKKGGALWASLAWSLGATLTAAVAMALSVPLWFIPPLVLVLPPLIWGWLTYRVMAYDALADHASVEERREIFRSRPLPLLAIGVLSGYLGAAPSLIWASGALFIALAPVLVPLAIWIYTLVFAFSSLWFSHYALGELALLRQRKGLPHQLERAQAAPEILANERSFSKPHP
jgi:Etoposide-induced protein 2.4 (EI24)